MRRVSAIHEAIAGDDIYTLEDGQLNFVGIKLDKVKSWMMTAKDKNEFFPLSVQTKYGLAHISKIEARSYFGLQTA